MIKFKNLVAGKFKNSKSGQTKQRQKADEETMILATRFIAFEHGCMLILLYIRDKPLRDYGIFNSHPNDTSRPIPSIQWDSMVTNTYQLN